MAGLTLHTGDLLFLFGVDGLSELELHEFSKVTKFFPFESFVLDLGVKGRHGRGGYVFYVTVLDLELVHPEVDVLLFINVSRKVLLKTGHKGRVVIVGVGDIDLALVLEGEDVLHPLVLDSLLALACPQGLGHSAQGLVFVLVSDVLQGETPLLVVFASIHLHRKEGQVEGLVDVVVLAGGEDRDGPVVENHPYRQF